MPNIIHVIIINNEYNIHGLEIHRPYCMCGWTGGEFIDIPSAARAGNDVHINVVKKMRHTK